MVSAKCYDYDSCQSQKCDVRIRMESGWVCGRLRRAEDGSKYASFRGVPYGKPPLGERRFKVTLQFPRIKLNHSTQTNISSVLGAGAGGTLGRFCNVLCLRRCTSMSSSRLHFWPFQTRTERPERRLHLSESPRAGSSGTAELAKHYQKRAADTSIHSRRSLTVWVWSYRFLWTRASINQRYYSHHFQL